MTEFRRTGRSGAGLALMVSVCVIGALAAATPTVTTKGALTVVSSSGYRLSLRRGTMAVSLELADGSGGWLPLAAKPFEDTLGLLHGLELRASSLNATWALKQEADRVVVGRAAVLDSLSGCVLTHHAILTDDGALLGAEVTCAGNPSPDGIIWFPPRIELAGQTWTDYAFRDANGRRHAGAISELSPLPAYMGRAAWGGRGDTADDLSGDLPALELGCRAHDRSMGIVFLDWRQDWRDARVFVQHYTEDSTLLYGGFDELRNAPGIRWVWLAPLSGGAGDDAHAERIRSLVARGERLVNGFKGIAPPVVTVGQGGVPDFPAELRSDRPVARIEDAVVYTMNESTDSEYALLLARKTGADMLVRGWFKWNQAPDVARQTRYVKRAHAMGALFGGGITCSALYDGENGLSQEQMRDMATRGADGQLVNAWGHAGIRHGSLSSAAYLDYLFRWCREQIDAGADYLFMDEINAALGPNEGYDDYSCHDFREYLTAICAHTREWPLNDSRWASEYKVDMRNAAVCFGGSMETFDYRAYLAALGAEGDPHGPRNPLRDAWHEFRRWRDDRAWKTLTDRIRAYASDTGRKVYISGNGIAPYVDLQVLGVWGRWLTQDGHIDLSVPQIETWHSIVREGRSLAGRDVPVVLFHDWGFGTPPFPWLAVPSAEREVWMRTRGAEIYAAGAFFAFPVLGPFGCDAGRDGTIGEVGRQSVFYHRYRDMFLKGRFLGSRCVSAKTPDLSLAVWRGDEPNELLVHVINRLCRAGRLEPRENVVVRLPVAAVPASSGAVSPDWEAEQPVAVRAAGGALELGLPRLEAYAVVRLRFAAAPNVAALRDPPRACPRMQWGRPARNEFRVQADGEVEEAGELNGFLQGKLHPELRNPPTFVVDARGRASVTLCVNSVATLGGRLRWSVDGVEAASVELPDRDGKNSEGAREYEREVTFDIPAGHHRVTIENVGGDWLTIDWYEFKLGEMER